MNAVPRTRVLVAALGAVLLFSVSACTSADPDSPGSSAAGTAVSTSSVDVATSGDVTTDSAVAAEGTTEGVTPHTDSPATGPATIDPAPTTEVPVAGGGNVDETVSAVEPTTASPVPLSSPGSFGGGVDVMVDELARVETVARGPGEVSGPGVAVTITLANNSDAPIPIDAVTVTLVDGDGVPAASMSGPPARPFSGQLAAAETAQGVFVFALPDDHANPVTVSVSYSAAAPIVQFAGDTG